MHVSGEMPLDESIEFRRLMSIIYDIAPDTHATIEKPLVD